MRTVALALALLLAGTLAGPGVASDAPGELLPDLAMAPPADFSVQHRPGGERRLRFSTIVVNIGDGPFDIYGYDVEGDSVQHSSSLAVRQRIRDTAGNWTVHERPATMTYSGDGHDHWHVHGLQQYELAFEATPGDTIADGNKTGFCFYDTDHYSGDEPRHYYPDNVTVCHVEKETVRMGLTVGWGDKYPASIAGQYIDITGLPYGTYWLTVTADPDGEFFEKLDGNNVHRSKIRIERSGVTVLYQDPPPGTDTTAPAAPTGLTAQGGDTKVSLDWTDHPEAIAQYRVYRQLEGGSYALHGSATTSAYLDGDVANGTTYCYQVTAVDSSGNESAPSAEACATPSATSALVTVHIGDLDATSSSQGRTWTATVAVEVHDSTHGAVPGATVSGDWSGGEGEMSSCTTGDDGRCSVSSANIPKSVSSVGFTVTSVSSEAGAYASDHNHDPDGDSNGTTISASKSS